MLMFKSMETFPLCVFTYTIAVVIAVDLNF